MARKPALVGNPRHVQLSRKEPPDSLDFFPTPPWAARSLTVHLAEGSFLGMMDCWDPCCGEGHLVTPLRESFEEVRGSDIFDYGRGFEVLDFLEREEEAWRPDWIITNPPFNAGLSIIRKSLATARQGVAMFVAASFLAGQDRYHGLFRDRPPAEILHFSERVALLRGRWEPDASTATLYVWLVWRCGPGRYSERTVTRWLGPGQKQLHHKQSDVLEHARMVPAPLLEGL